MMDGKVVVNELAEKYEVTEETIRRDLEKLESDGYAKNFLLPKGLAIIAGAKEMNELKNRESAQQFKIETEKKEARELAEKLKNARAAAAQKVLEKDKAISAKFNS